MKPLTSFSLWVGLLVPGVVGAQEVGSLGHLSPALRLSAEAADVIGSDPWLAGGTYTYSQAAFGLGGVVELGPHLAVDVGVRTGLSAGVFPVWPSTEGALAPLSGMRADLRLDRFTLNFEQLLQGQASITLGRQDVVLGSGLLVADGFRSGWEVPLWRYVVPTEETLPVDEESISSASLFLAGLNYWDGGHVSLDLAAWGAGGDLLIARASPGSVSNSDIQPGVAEAPMVVAADGHLEARDGELGLTMLGTFLSEGFEFSTAARADLPLNDKLTVQGELSAQVGRDGEIPLLANGLWATLRWQDDMRERTPLMSLSFHHFSGDKSDTESRDEAWRGRFYARPDFLPGQVAGPAWLPQSDLDWLTLSAQVALLPRQTLGVDVFTILAGQGSTLCQTFTPEVDCATSATVAPHTPLAEEIDLAWSLQPKGMRGTIVGARGGLVKVLPGGDSLFPTSFNYSLGLHASFVR